MNNTTLSHLFKALSVQHKNIVFCPQSLDILFYLIWKGTEGECHQEISTLLGLTDPNGQDLIRRHHMLLNDNPSSNNSTVIF